MIKSILVFCGSSDGNRPIYIQSARRLGVLIARGGYRLVYGGGVLGCMGVLANAVKDNGGYVIGVIPKCLIDKEGRFEADEIYQTETLDQRKTLMLEKADATITLPGGNGSLEETVEAGTEFQLGLHQKPMVVVNEGGYWTPIKVMYRKMHREGFINARIPFNLEFVDHVDGAIPAILRIAGESIVPAGGNVTRLSRPFHAG